MKTKKFIHGITFFVTPEMYQKLKAISDKMQVGISELLREMIEQFLSKDQIKSHKN